MLGLPVAAPFVSTGKQFFAEPPSSSALLRGFIQCLSSAVRSFLKAMLRHSSLSIYHLYVCIYHLYDEYGSVSRRVHTEGFLSCYKQAIHLVELRCGKHGQQAMPSCRFPRDA